MFFYPRYETLTVHTCFRRDDPIKEEFYLCLRKSYEVGGKYIQEKFPLKNELLKLLSAIDPKCQGSTVAASMMKKLKTYFVTVITDDATADAFDLEVDKFHLETNLPAALCTDDSPKRLDEWWAEVFSNRKYPILFKMIKACLSIFTGPMIEQSFR